MVVSGGSKHALTVLWMGRWFSGSLISVPPLQETVPVGGTFTTEGEFLQGTRASVHRESSWKLHPSLCNPFSRKCVLACFSLIRSKDKDKKEETRWIMWIILIAGFCTVGVSFRHFYSFTVPGIAWNLDLQWISILKLSISRLTLVIDYAVRFISDPR